MPHTDRGRTHDTIRIPRHSAKDKRVQFEQFECPGVSFVVNDEERRAVPTAIPMHVPLRGEGGSIPLLLAGVTSGRRGLPGNCISTKSTRVVELDGV